jgi:hypothetical protein
MPAWTTITPEQLPIPPAELELLRNYKPENFDRFVADAIADGIAYVRGQLGARHGFQLDVDATLLPPELKRQAMWLIVESIKTDASIALALTPDQVRVIASARDDLAQVRTGDFSVSAPLNPQPGAESQAASGYAELLPARPRLFQRDATNGL